MNDNQEFLNFIYQNAEMGTTTVPRLLEITDEEPIRQHLKEQLADYRAICRRAEKLMHDCGGDIQEVGSMQKAGAQVMLNMQTTMDDSPSHIAEMMIKGSNRGLLEIQKHLNQYQNADSRVIRLGQDLMRIEQRNLDELKPFLQ